MNLRNTARKGTSKLTIIAASAVLLGTILGAVHFADLNLSSAGGDQCWHQVTINNQTFSSKDDLKNYLSNQGKSVPDKIQFKTINGTLYQEAQCIGGLQ